jgi:membrane-bound ClpP family serine protease
MEFIQEAIASRNIVAWIILVVLLIVIIKILQTAGKGLVILLIALGIVLIIAKVFPGLIAPIVDFVQGGWMGSRIQEQSWQGN